MSIEVVKSCEQVSLSVPRGDLAVSAMRVVVGWVASCNDLPLDSLDDINLAVETLIGEDTGEGGPLSLSLSIEDGCVKVSIDGLQNRDLQENLESRGPFEPTLRCPLDVKMFLDALVEHYEVVRIADDAFGVCMQKRIV